MQVFKVSAASIRRFNAYRPVVDETVIPAQDGFPGYSDEVRLLPGQWLEIVEHGSPTKWSKAVIRWELRELLILMFTVEAIEPKLPEHGRARLHRAVQGRSRFMPHNYETQNS